MKKVIKTVLFLIIMFISINKVKANTISNIDMDIYIDSKGTAHITEIWNATLNQGTEGYKSYKNLGKARISNLKVTDGDKEYTNIGEWDINKTFSEKAYKSGLHSIDNGVEMCFGISKYGSHKYKISYDIEGFVSETTDAQMIYWNLLPSELSSYTKNVSITIYADKEFEDTLDVWGYGNYGGLAYVSDGKIHMSNDDLKSGEYMTILVKFNPETFETDNTLDYDFNHYLDMAKDGEELYKQNKTNRLEIILLMIFALFISLILPILLGIIFVVVFKPDNKTIRSGKTLLIFGETGKKLPKDKEVNMFRDIPCNKDIYRAYWVAKNYGLMNRQTDFLGAVILKWRRDEMIKIENHTVGKIFKKEDTTIVFPTPTISSGVELEDDLYKYMYEASKDGILEGKEFEKWCRRNYSKILKWFDKVLDYENEKLEKEGILTPSTRKVLFFTEKTYIVNPTMKEEAIKMQGLKKFFKEFDNMSDKEAIQVMLWQEYLMYAQIFGVAKQVAKQFKKLYPDVITDYNYESIIFINTISYSGMSSARSAASSYSSGGGGFSSGGGGGGSFGGGGGGGFR